VVLAERATENVQSILADNPWGYVIFPDKLWNLTVQLVQIIANKLSSAEGLGTVSRSTRVNRIF